MALRDEYCRRLAILIDTACRNWQIDDDTYDPRTPTRADYFLEHVLEKSERTFWRMARAGRCLPESKSLHSREAYERFCTRIEPYADPQQLKSFRRYVETTFLVPELRWNNGTKTLKEFGELLETIHYPRSTLKEIRIGYHLQEIGEHIYDHMRSLYLDNQYNEASKVGQLFIESIPAYLDKSSGGPRFYLHHLPQDEDAETLAIYLDASPIIELLQTLNNNIGRNAVSQLTLPSPDHLDASHLLGSFMPNRPPKLIQALAEWGLIKIDSFTSSRVMEFIERDAVLRKNLLKRDILKIFEHPSNFSASIIAQFETIRPHLQEPQHCLAKLDKIISDELNLVPPDQKGVLPATGHLARSRLDLLKNTAQPEQAAQALVDAKNALDTECYMVWAEWYIEVARYLAAIGHSGMEAMALQGAKELYLNAQNPSAAVEAQTAARLSATRPVAPLTYPTNQAHEELVNVLLETHPVSLAKAAVRPKGLESIVVRPARTHPKPKRRPTKRILPEP